jgi:hypothetical protein
MKTLALCAALLTAGSVWAEEDADDDAVSRTAESAGLSAALVEKLSPDQLADVLKTHESEQNGGTVAWLASVSFFVFALGSVALGCLVWMRAQRERQLTLRAAIEKGNIPAGLFDPPKRNDLRRGVLLIAAGVGLAIPILIISPDKVWASVGTLPMLLGAGYLVSGRLSPKALEAKKEEAAVV